MLCVVSKKCNEKGCAKLARYGTPGGKTRRCIEHQTAVMVLGTPGEEAKPSPLPASTAPLPPQAETTMGEMGVMGGDHSFLPDSNPRIDGACWATLAAAAAAAAAEFAGAHFTTPATPGTATVPPPPSVGLPLAELEFPGPIFDPFPSHSGDVQPTVPATAAAADVAAVVGGCGSGSGESLGGGGAREGGTGALPSPDAVRDVAHSKRKRVGEANDNATVTFVACGEPLAVHGSGAHTRRHDELTAGTGNGSSARVAGGGRRGGGREAVAAVATKAVRRVGARSGKGVVAGATGGLSVLQQIAPHPMKWPSMAVQGFLPRGGRQAPGLSPAGGLNLAALLQQCATARLCFPPGVSGRSDAVVGNNAQQYERLDSPKQQGQV